MKWHSSYSIRMSTQVIPTYSSVSTSKSINSGHPSNRLSLDIMVFWAAQSWHDGDLFAHWFSITLCKWLQFNTADLISLVLKADSTWDSTGGGMVQLSLLCINDWLMGHVADLGTKGPCHSYFFIATVKTLLWMDHQTISSLLEVPGTNLFKWDIYCNFVWQVIKCGYIRENDKKYYDLHLAFVIVTLCYNR